MARTPFEDRVERKRLEREAQERRDAAAYPPPVVDGAGSRSVYPHRVNSLGREKVDDHTANAWSNVWKIVGIIAGAAALGFGGAKAITPDHGKKIDALGDEIKENEKTRQNDQRNIEHTIAGLHEEISLLKRDLKVQPPLEVKAKATP